MFSIAQVQVCSKNEVMVTPNDCISLIVQPIYNIWYFDRGMSGLCLCCSSKSILAGE